eukprot:214592_1
MNVAQVTVVPNSLAGSYTATPNPAVVASPAADDFNYVALGIVLVCVLAALIVGVVVLISYKKRQDKKKQPAKYAPTTSYGTPPTQGNMKANPVGDFDRRSAAPYDGTEPGSPALQKGRSQRWGNESGVAPV